MEEAPAPAAASPASPVPAPAPRCPPPRAARMVARLEDVARLNRAGLGKGHPPCRLRPRCERAFLRGRRQPRCPCRKLPADRRRHHRAAGRAARTTVRLPRRHATNLAGSAERWCAISAARPTQAIEVLASRAPEADESQPPPGDGRGLSRRRARRRRSARPLDRFSLGAAAGPGIDLGARPAAAAALFDRVFAKACRQRRRI